MTTSGGRDSEASATAGGRVAPAVPEVVRTATGLPGWAAGTSKPGAVELGAFSDRVGEEQLRCEAVREPGVWEGLGDVGGGRDADRSLERAREVYGKLLRDLERDSRTADLGQLDGRIPARAGRGPRVLDCDDCLVGSEGDAREPLQVAELGIRCDRLLGELEWLHRA